MTPSLTANRKTLYSRLFVVIAGTALGITLLVFLLRSVKLDQLGAAFSNVDYRYLLIAIPPFLINLLLKVPRWGLLFGEDAPNSDSLFGALTVGYAINALLPARLGEIVRAYWVRDRAGVGMVQALSTIALERVSDGVTLVIMLVLTAPTVAFPRELLGPALTVGVVFVVALVIMIVLASSANREDHPLTSILLRLEHGKGAIVARLVRQTVMGLGALRSRRAVLLLVLYTICIWASNSVLIWLVLRAFHISVPLIAGVLLTAVLNLGMAVPSSPGYVGIFEYLIVLTLGLYGIGHTSALAAALAFHAVAFVPVTIIGLFYIVRVGLETTLQMVRAGNAGSQDAVG